MTTTVTPDESAVDALTERLRGEILFPGDEGYDGSRTVWNGMIDKYPSIVVRARGVADVMAAVDFVRESDVPFAVQGGGHSVAGLSTVDDGLLLDLGEMDDVRVDPAARTARVGAGATLADLDHETQAFGLATTLGVASPTGVAGLTLGGGNGHLSRAYGLACDNLLAADVVTADGALVHTSESENPDLFWAIRGGGGNFGVVTSFEFQLHDVGPEVLAGPVFHRIEDAPTVFRETRDVMLEASDDVGCIVGVMSFPPEEPFPQDLHGTPGAFVLPFFAGDVADGEASLAPLREIGDPVLDGVAPIPYLDLQQMFDEANPDGNRYYWKSEIFNELSDEAIDTLVEYVAENPFPTPFTQLTIEILGGAINRVDVDATAYPHREAMYDLGIWGNWTDPADDQRVIKWVRDLHNAIALYADDAVYVNYLDADEDDRVRAAYGPNYDRLVQVKTEWDPENLFQLNKNVEPAG